MQQGRSITFKRIYVALLSLAAANGAVAAELDTQLMMGVGAVLSDNVCLTPDKEKSELFATATPGIRTEGRGARASIDLLFSLEFNSLAEKSGLCPRGSAGVVGNKKSPAPLLRLVGSSELVEDWLFFDVRGYADQNSIDPFGVSGGDNLNARSNTNTTYQYTLSPYIQRRLTDRVNLLARYSFDEHFNTESLINDSTSNSALIDIGSSPQIERWSLGLVANYSRVDYDDSFGEETGNNELSSAVVRAAYQLNYQWQINGFAGQEWNDFLSFSDDIDGVYWDIGLQWTPNERVSVGVGTGDRFFGSTPRFDIEYRHRRSKLRLSYEKDLTYNRNLRNTDQFTDNNDDFIDLNGPSGSDQTFAGTPTTVTNRPILNERWLLAYTFSGRRTTVNVTGSYSEQTRAEDGFTDLFSNYGVFVNRRLSATLSANASLNWFDREEDESREPPSRNSDTWRFSVGLDRDITNNTLVSLRYQYSDRNSDQMLEEYVENRVILSLDHRF